MPIPSPLSENTDLVSLTILSNGSAIPGTYQVRSVHITKGVNQISSAQIILGDGSPDTEEFPVSDSASFAPGTEIEIQLGYHSRQTSVFKGLVIKHGLRITGQQGGALVVECFDQAVKMTIGRKNQYFAQLEDGAVIKSVIGSNGLPAAVTATQPTTGPTSQHDCTDWDFIVTRARANGMVVLMEAGTVTVAPPDLSRTPVFRVAYGESLLAFAGGLDVRTQVASVKCSTWDEKNQKLISASAAPKNLNFIGSDSSSTLAKVTGGAGYQLETTAPFSEAMLQNWADAVMLQSEMAKLCGVVKFQGGNINPGDMLELAGLGRRFTGNAYVGGVVHTVENGNWTTEATLGIEPEWFAGPANAGGPAAHAMSPPVTGLQIGLVKKIHEDPAGSYRVLVDVPLLNSPVEGVWAQLTHDYATQDAGLYFYPEIGDEVILGFRNGNAQCPVILGSLNGSRQRPVHTPEVKNSRKAITTRSKLSIAFDDENKVLQITTPGGNSLTLSDTDKAVKLGDQNGNLLKMSASGIEFSSDRDITIKAAQNISISATGKLNLDTVQDLAAKGLNVSLTAKLGLTAKGGSSAELSASGQTVVKGAMVMIN